MMGRQGKEFHKMALAKGSRSSGLIQTIVNMHAEDGSAVAESGSEVQ